ncbi:prepilin-type N-terminal cleavage/methylation domain-containing protein [Massilia sp. Dwa41.01b]|nr:prepilin-type N-terminal cleavage/methylation domain-containing protein [Massilia sp. Se16.2.3]QNA89387.1 prepilin-type N-terminal cleavage/methylation domain-containing protein [Massilia sp. Dwa41.01b]QNB00285.1 prepilin-type N-terminal cleavage/methylation domain-containing protein [Massilia sp. Se16.2.3]
MTWPTRRSPGALARRGFTLIEAMVALAILAIILSIGVPMMSEWTYKNQVASATQFYSEGLVMARNQALSNNSFGRMVLTPNGNGQKDWQVDICFPTPETPCTRESDNWSTLEAAAADDPAGATGFKSVLRPADALPAAAVLQQTFTPATADAVYFTPLGWVDTTVPNGLRRIVLEPRGSRAGATPKVAVALTLAGIASRCKPDATQNDPQRCPP